MSNIELTEEQQEAVDAIAEWAAGNGNEISLGGYAGTGKTTIIRYLVEGIAAKAVVLTPTGKAACVLRSKGIDADTIHSFIYRCVGEVEKKNGEMKPVFERKEAEEVLFRGIIIVDEASMVNQEMANDLRSLDLGFRIIWVGDHGQLPPVGGDPGIMRSPNIVLTTIHRQAEKSPIIRLAHRVRAGEPFGRLRSPDESVVFVENAKSANKIVDVSIRCELDTVLVGMNSVRHDVNAEYRERIGFHDPLCVGDKVICLLNNRKLDIFNGQTFKITELGEVSTWGGMPWEQDATIHDGEREVDVRILLTRLGKQSSRDDENRSRDACLFDYAYAITVHKSQGSEWNRVGLVDCYSSIWENNRWRYTGVTRAKDRLVVFR